MDGLKTVSFRGNIKQNDELRNDFASYINANFVLPIDKTNKQTTKKKQNIVFTPCLAQLWIHLQPM